MTLTYGGLFAGYGGLELGVQSVLGGETLWHAEYDAAPSRILAHHWPDVPNLGDVTKVKWSDVPPVDVITGGSPCQDLSHAGRRAGMKAGTRSGLWASMCDAIDTIRPSLVIWENVRGAYSAEADSDVEPCPLCVGDEPGVTLRALGRVLGDLAELGYDAVWIGLRAADIGAPHGRFRVFVVAHPAGDPWRFLHRDSATAADADRLRHERGGGARGRWTGPADSSLLPTPRATDGTKGGPNQRGTSGDLMLPSAVTLLGTPRASDWKGTGPVGSKSHDHMLDRAYLTAQVALLPTPAVNEMGEGKTVEAWDAWTEKMQAAHGNGNGHGKSLSIEAQRLLPTPTTMDYRASGGNPDTTGTHGTTLTDATVRQPEQWGIYADAIARWEHVLGRPAPAPTQPSKKGTPQLSPAFSEWMMGLPAGHVTGVPGLSRNDMLKALGNGVVPQQAAEAVSRALAVASAEERAA